MPEFAYRVKRTGARCVVPRTGGDVRESPGTCTGDFPRRGAVVRPGPGRRRAAKPRRMRHFPAGRRVAGPPAAGWHRMPRPGFTAGAIEPGRDRCRGRNAVSRPRSGHSTGPPISAAPEPTRAPLPDSAPVVSKRRGPERNRPGAPGPGLDHRTAGPLARASPSRRRRCAGGGSLPGIGAVRRGRGAAWTAAPCRVADWLSSGGVGPDAGFARDRAGTGPREPREAAAPWRRRRHKPGIGAPALRARGRRLPCEAAPLRSAGPPGARSAR